MLQLAHLGRVQWSHMMPVVTHDHDKQVAVVVLGDSTVHMTPMLMVVMGVVV